MLLRTLPAAVFAALAAIPACALEAAPVVPSPLAQTTEKKVVTNADQLPRRQSSRAR